MDDERRRIEGADALMGGQEKLQPQKKDGDGELPDKPSGPVEDSTPDKNPYDIASTWEAGKSVQAREAPEKPGEGGFGAGVQLLQRYVGLCRRKRALSAEKTEVQKQIDRIGPQIRDMLLQAGVQNMKVKAEVEEKGEAKQRQFTLYIHKQVWASPADGISNAEAVRVLQEFGYEGMTMPTSSAVSTLFRGDPGEIEGLHPKIRETFDATEKVTVRVRKA